MVLLHDGELLIYDTHFEETNTFKY